MNEELSPVLVGRGVTALFKLTPRPLRLHDPVYGTVRDIPSEAIGEVDGLLPLFLAAAEAIWFEAFGHGFALKLCIDHQSLLGYRVVSLGCVGFVGVMLHLMEAIFQIARPDMILLNDFSVVWQSAKIRLGVASDTDALLSIA
ncbi:hypothetical protein [Beijerinckia indica]|uniref:Uncharacterized protein n=1 Tax=Beijerinckia indica subsp. indica (strain ATCC 9039 / DSM 1715 / NCIMB 8712) TaxID=395963 RepID=B2IL33_BEII9|nr:hypothetical protein [Beijerinckia indica]ACB97233.1 hypothetical protein Bind_3681 [Beijerinckia indica subsp. indica ATCC 9039]